MGESLMGALITGGLALIGTIVSVVMTSRKSQAVIDVKIEELTREVREHNGFAKRLPVLEEKVSNLTDRVDKLEDKAS